MKKILILLFVLLLLFSSYNFSQELKKAKPLDEVVVKTYFLNHITPRDVERSLNFYFGSFSGDRHSNMFTIRIYKDKIEEFERLLKKIDVEKKRILFRIFTVIASNEGNGDEIRNKDLKKVLAELKNVLSFKSYKLDGVSMLTAKEGPNENILTLLTKLPNLNLLIGNIKIKGDMPGKRVIEIGELRLREYKNSPLILTETSIKENGYLVAGVSRVGKNGDALVLVINAEIK